MRGKRNLHNLCINFTTSCIGNRNQNPQSTMNICTTLPRICILVCAVSAFLLFTGASQTSLEQKLKMSTITSKKEVKTIWDIPLESLYSLVTDFYKKGTSIIDIIFVHTPIYYTAIVVQRRTLQCWTMSRRSGCWRSSSKKSSARLVPIKTVILATLTLSAHTEGTYRTRVDCLNRGMIANF